MGAYTFTKHPPFKINAISPHAITSDAFIPTSLHTVVVFPMSYYFEDKYGKVIVNRGSSEIFEEDPDSTIIVVTVGVHDRASYNIKMGLSDLLNSLRPMSC